MKEQTRKIRKAKAQEDEIRFYVNDNEYAYARVLSNGDIQHGIKIKCQERKENKRNFSSKNIASFAIFIFLLFIEYKVSIGIFRKIAYINPYIAIVAGIIDVLMNIHMFIIVTEFINEAKSSRAWKKNHAAEHMMINYMKKFGRLPESKEKLKKCSRFKWRCGSRNLLRKTTKIFIRLELWMIFLIVAAIILYLITQNDMVRIIGAAILYIIMYKIDQIIIPNFISKIQGIIGIIFQIANTSKDISQLNYELAYYAAKEWMEYKE